ncbi:MAG: hypothetical protein M1814_003623 [Vezdaea aestivalis]|nr:MAG: hypothetical protein M1814_003623 [Vezdaea aestivalis]
MVKRSVVALLLGAGLALAGGNTQPSSSVFIHTSDGFVVSQDAQYISWDSAISLIALRLGLSSYYTASGFSDHEIELANVLSSDLGKLFDDEEYFVSNSKTVVFVEDVEANDVSALTSSSTPAFFATGQHPLSNDIVKHYLGQRISSADERMIFAGVKALSHETIHAVEQYGLDSKLPDAVRGLVRVYVESTYVRGYLAGVRIEGLKTVSAAFGASSDEYTQTLQTIRDYLGRIEEKCSETIIVLSPFVPRKPFKYFVGSHQQQKRGAAGRQVQSEAPLSEFSDSEPALKSSSSISAEPTRIPYGNVTLEKGKLLPICHSKRGAAIKATKNCTGRGEVYLKYKSKNDGDKAPEECWACRCHSTYQLTESGSKQTTYWSGTACQKQDISSPFFLIAGFSILLVGLVGWGIGMLFSIGQETLPGVIGAGVAGPRAK